jgi:hypothetical protein
MNLQFLQSTDTRHQPALADVEAKIEELRWLNMSDRDKAWTQLDLAFKTAPMQKDSVAWQAFWFIYTDFTWGTLRAKDREFFVNIAISRQIPMAVMTGSDVLREIMLYLDFRAIDNEDCQSLFSKAKTAFLNSSAYIGKIDNQDFTVADLVKKIKYFNSVSDNSLAEAKFRDDLQRAIYPKEQNFLYKYFQEDKELTVTSLLNLVDFFLGVEPDKIWYIVEAYVNPDLMKESPETASNSKLNYAEIKQQMENKYKKDAEGNFQELEKVLIELNDLAEKYTDPKIAELYYFDEVSGKFVWNI